MQDSAPSHAARDAIQDLEERGVIRIRWPSFSPESWWNESLSNDTTSDTTSQLSWIWLGLRVDDGSWSKA